MFSQFQIQEMLFTHFQRECEKYKFCCWCKIKCKEWSVVGSWFTRCSRVDGGQLMQTENKDSNRNPIKGTRKNGENGQVERDFFENFLELFGFCTRRGGRIQSQKKEIFEISPPPQKKTFFFLPLKNENSKDSKAKREIHTQRKKLLVKNSLKKSVTREKSPKLISIR